MMVMTTTFYVWFKNETEIISDSDVGELNGGVLSQRSLKKLDHENVDDSECDRRPHIIVRVLTPYRVQRSMSTIKEQERKRNQTQLMDLIRHIDSFEIFMQHLAKVSFDLLHF